MNDFFRSVVKNVIPDCTIDLFYKYRYIFYIGNKFICPFCCSSFRMLLPQGLNHPVLREKNVVGGGYRLNARCPRCGSSDRERLLYLYLRNKTGVFSEKLKLLHVAPEKRLQPILEASSNLKYVTVDIDSPSAMYKMDVTNMQYVDEYFDVVLCNHVFEHIENDSKAISEIFRVLKVGGWAILQVPISKSLEKTYENPMVTTPEAREKTFGQYDHVRIYGRDYRDRLERIGFSVQEYSYVMKFGEKDCYKYGLSRDENIYVCFRPKVNITVQA